MTPRATFRISEVSVSARSTWSPRSRLTLLSVRGWPSASWSTASCSLTFAIIEAPEPPTRRRVQPCRARGGRVVREPDDLERVMRALATIEAVEDPVVAAAVLAYRITRTQG